MDYNDYVGNTGVALFNGTAENSLSAIQGSFGGNTNSTLLSPLFVSGTNVHLQQIAGNAPLAAGTPIAAPSITTDIDGDTRSVTTPDIGADETNFVISYTPVANTCNTGDVALTATIVNAAGINNSTNPPLIYFRKNGGSWFTSIGNLASGTAKRTAPGTLRFLLQLWAAWHCLMWYNILLLHKTQQVPRYIAIHPQDFRQLPQLPSPHIQALLIPFLRVS